MTIYQADRREVEFDVSHAAFSAAFEELLGRTDVRAFADVAPLTAEAARDRLASFVGPLDFSLFQKIDHGGLRTAFAGKPTQAATYVFGNALIAVQMTTYDARAGLYVPLRLFVQEVANSRVMVTYDLPSATMMQFGVPAIDDVARSLDDKVQRLLAETVTRASSKLEA
jgi:uncharacterized protein (DUF302 family)